MVARSGVTRDGFRWRLAPALDVAWDEIVARYPERGEAQPGDGTIASAAHSQQNPTSDHEADRSDGFVKASDFSDMWAGFDPDDWLDEVIARQDVRVKYIIKDEMVWRGYWSTVSSQNRPVNPADVVNGRLPPFRAAHYTGSNPHITHAHLSVTDDGARSTATWFPEEDDVDAQERQWLERTHAMIADQLPKLRGVVDAHRRTADERYAEINGRLDTIEETLERLIGRSVPEVTDKASIRLIREIAAELGINPEGDGGG